jgi:multiple sugar transport system ATP-binding protein
MAEVRFDGVSKRFGDFYAVRDFTLEVEDGEFLALVGPSGCGKSTTLRMLAGLEEITEGEIAIGGRVVNEVPAKDRDIAMVFQSYALYPHMNARDNMAFALKLRNRPKEEIARRVEAAATTLGISELLERKPAQLSGGQRQRVALGRAIVREPAAFLLDEPLSNLDAKLRVQTRAEVSKLHRRLGTTFIYVTHDQVEAMTMATRIAVMDAGMLQQIGSPRELYDRPRNVFVAGFIGSPSMNFFDMEVKSSDGALTLEGAGMRIDVPPEYRAPLGAHAGRKIVAGIRPEHVHDPAHQPDGVVPAPVEAHVDLAELLGNETLLHLLTDGHPFLARVDPRTMARPGQPTRVVFDLSHLHAFDSETRARIALRGGEHAAADAPRSQRGMAPLPSDVGEAS